MKKYILIGLIFIAAALLLSITVLKGNTGACIFIAVFGTVLLFFALFETKRVVCEKIVLIALLSSLASAGRVMFSAIASVQPASFIIMVTGVVFGGEVGFITGAVTALSSNLLLGQGIWTVWQMFAWGMMGFISGLLSKLFSRSRVLFSIYGFLWGFIFGWIMNGWFLLSGYEESNFAAFITACTLSFGMDLAHGVSNALLAFFLSKRFIKIFGRIALKYNLKSIKNRERRDM